MSLVSIILFYFCFTSFFTEESHVTAAAASHSSAHVHHLHPSSYVSPPPPPSPRRTKAPSALTPCRCDTQDLATTPTYGPASPVMMQPKHGTGVIPHNRQRGVQIPTSDGDGSNDEDDGDNDDGDDAGDTNTGHTRPMTTMVTNARLTTSLPTATGPLHPMTDFTTHLLASDAGAASDVTSSRLALSPTLWHNTFITIARGPQAATIMTTGGGRVTRKWQLGGNDPDHDDQDYDEATPTTVARQRRSRPRPQQLEWWQRLCGNNDGGSGGGDDPDEATATTRSAAAAAAGVGN
ncbi:hypothetical protein EDB85DRAFT_2137923 [Lactarius pseudohatsudake]|nr:hypothetical protein EDB85DRAFT_2137923 [Lactarius pseudohatsudake]